MSAQARYSDAEIDDLKRRCDLGKVAGDLGAVLRVRHNGLIGSCPMCGGGKNPKRATRFSIKDDFWACAVCSDGGDVIKLVRLATGRGFADAVAFLGGIKSITAAEAAKLAAERREREEARARQEEQHRKAELMRLYDIWRNAKRIFPRGPVSNYLAWRGLALPDSALLRESESMPYYEGEETTSSGKTRPRIIHRGPAMLSPFINNEGKFSGLHITWLHQKGEGKAVIIHPDTGEALAAKKMRGHSKGAHLVLRQPAVMKRLFLAEGIENALAVARALHRQARLLDTDAFWAAGSLGNLGGPHKSTFAHPTLRSQPTPTRPTGVPLRIPGPDPAEGEAIAVPDAVSTLVLLGDGDSEAVLTQAAMDRARRRYATSQRSVAVVMAPGGFDFDDVLMGKMKEGEAA